MLLGILLGVVLNHGAAVYLGCFLSNMINENLLQMFAGLMFIIFGIITIVFDEENEKDRNFKFGPVVTTALTFFLGEIGDKTQLTAMTLAMEGNYPLLILSGSVAGMLCIGFVGIIIGNDDGPGFFEFMKQNGWLLAYSFIIIAFSGIALLFIPVQYKDPGETDKPSESLKNCFFAVLFFEKIIILLLVYLLLEIGKHFFNF